MGQSKHFPFPLQYACVCVFGYRATSVKIHFPAELDNASISNVFVTKNICARTGKHIKENVCEKK